MSITNYTRTFTQPWATDALPTLIRITLGVLLVYHGSSKVFEGMGGMTQSLTERGWPMPTMQAFAAAYIEFAGGVMLIVGLMTRPVAFMNITLFSIIFFVFHGADAFAKKEKAFLFLVLAVYTFLAGPGKASVDSLLFKDQKPDQKSY